MSEIAIACEVVEKHRYCKRAKRIGPFHYKGENLTVMKSGEVFFTINDRWKMSEPITHCPGCRENLYQPGEYLPEEIKEKLEDKRPLWLSGDDFF